MKNVIVIINPKVGADLSNVQQCAKNDQPNALGVWQISDRVWLIDLHTSLAFFAGLLHSANDRGLDSFVYEVVDTIQEDIHSSTRGQVPK